jgi:transposase-like protein
MTPSSKRRRKKRTPASPEEREARRAYTEEEKRAAVEAWRNRGDKPMSQVLAETGVSSASLIHYWQARMRLGEPLTPLGGPHRRARVDAPADAAKAIDDSATPDRVKIALLRDEVARLRRMLAAALMSEDDVRGTAWGKR